MQTETSINHIPANSVQGAVSGSVISRPILFSTEMVQAILDGRKTQTRRIVKEPFQTWMQTTTNPEWWNGIETQCKHGQIGDILWVRETWQYVEFGCEPEECGYVYKASENGRDWQDNDKEWKWKPSIFMPREACRIELRITNIKVERLQSISEEDAICEGVKKINNGIYECYTPDTDPPFLNAKESFETLWKSINGELSWNENPFVWAITFERTEMPSKHYR